MYCKNCGRIIENNSAYCSRCGVRLSDSKKQAVSDDSSNFGFAILGFVIPIVGLILFLIYEKENPKRAKSAGKGALIGCCALIAIVTLLVILYIVLFFGLMSSLYG